MMGHPARRIRPFRLETHCSLPRYLSRSASRGQQWTERLIGQGVWIGYTRRKALSGAAVSAARPMCIDP